MRRRKKSVLKKSVLSCPDQGEIVLFLLERVRCGLGGGLRPERWRVEVVKWAQNSRNGAFWGDTKPLGDVPKRVVARLVRPVGITQRPLLGKFVYFTAFYGRSERKPAQWFEF